MSSSTPLPPEPGTLYLVATPIGSARDITLRALDLLSQVDVLAAEDTRVARRLLEIHGIALGTRPLLAYHDHNGPDMRPKLIAALKDGKSVAYVSDAGTPMVADPGYRLVKAASDAGINVRAAPGPSAALAALTVAGLPSDRFLFEGFLPPQDGAARRVLEALAHVPATLIFFETPGRLQKFLDRAADVLGKDRPAAVCRELTKRFEDVRRGPLGALKETVNQMTLKGEMVIVIGFVERAVDRETIAQDLLVAMQTHRIKDAAGLVAQRHGWSRRDVYQMALEMKDKS
ncbi:MAG: 16S rRNA (cytidine(1402)-2'-O)-methyltransferase [Pseudomonadota bacterium]